MSLWIIISIAAATFQTIRFMLQKLMAQQSLSAAGATFARFLYSAPFVVVFTAIYLNYSGQDWPRLGLSFWIFAVCGALAQVLATVCIVLVFKSRNFAVGTTFKNSEVLFAVLVGFVVLDDQVSALGLGAIILGVIGVVLLSAEPEQLAWRWRNLVNRAAGLGLLAGALFAVSAVTYRGASMQIALEDFWARAAITLAMVTSVQMLGMAAWLAWRDPPQIGAVWRGWRVAIWIGIMSMAGSFGWFTAFSLQNAAYVKAVGQVELILSLFATVIFFREKIVLREWVGMGILAASVLIIVLAI